MNSYVIFNNNQETSYDPICFHIKLEWTLCPYQFAWQEANITLSGGPIPEWLRTQGEFIIQKQVPHNFYFQQEKAFTSLSPFPRYF